ncbi:dihydrolipoyl dehydrogenase family protein [Richelia intracellularis]|nr:NAD(P)/FAD-dependent oxidoreductase [Richelia intracellularis]
MIDYDVVIIGGTIAGRYAALTATSMNASVALVEPQVNYSLIQQYAISQLAYNMRFTSNNLLGANTSLIGKIDRKDTGVLADTMLFANQVVSYAEEQNSPIVLATKGVDIIYGNGQFQSSPHLVFATSERLLKARTYLVATGSYCIIPKIPGLLTTGFLTIENIWQYLYKKIGEQGIESISEKHKLPQNWVILGGSIQSVEIAQTLKYLGYKVTLIVPCTHIIPSLDLEIAFILQTQLEAEGINILTKTQIMQVECIDGQKCLHTREQVIRTDEILVATPSKPNIESLGLPKVGVKWHKYNQLKVNLKLQTNNRRIYACGDVLGGFNCVNIANYEAKIAINNALSLPKLKVNYLSIPWAVLTNPMVAQVGFIETLAKQQYCQKEFFVLRQFYKNLIKAHIQDETTGICKLIVLRNGEIIGGSIFGSQAGELINIITLAITHKIKINQLADLYPIYPSFSEILQQISNLWRGDT